MMTYVIRQMLSLCSIVMEEKDCSGKPQSYPYVLKCPGLTCAIDIAKPRFLVKIVDLWSYMHNADR